MIEAMTLSENLKRLKKVTDAAIEAAEAHRTYRPWPVNWGDLRCIAAMFWLDDECNDGYEVLIQEASPTATEFQNWIADYLDQHGWPNVEVKTAW